MKSYFLNAQPIFVHNVAATNHHDQIAMSGKFSHRHAVLKQGLVDPSTFKSNSLILCMLFKTILIIFHSISTSLQSSMSTHYKPVRARLIKIRTLSHLFYIL